MRPFERTRHASVLISAFSCWVMQCSNWCTSVPLSQAVQQMCLCLQRLPRYPLKGPRLFELLARAYPLWHKCLNNGGKDQAAQTTNNTKPPKPAPAPAFLFAARSGTYMLAHKIQRGAPAGERKGRAKLVEQGRCSMLRPQGDP